MNKKLIIIILIVVLICGASIFVMSKNLFDKKDPGTTNALSAAIRVEGKEMKWSTSTTNVDIIMPRFDNLANNYNSYLNSKVNSELSFDTVFNEVTAGMNENEVGFFDYEVRFDRYDCYDIISVVATQKIEFGESRTITRKKCYNVNVRENRTAELKDVFLNKTNYKKKIMEEINSQAEKKEIELKGGKLNYLSESQVFYISNGKLYIYFDAAEIAAASYGELDFEMPFRLEDGLFIY